MNVFFQDPVMGNDVFRVSRRVEDSQPGVHRRQVFRHFPTVHTRHDDVGNEKVNVSLVTLRHIQCDWAVRRRKHDVAELFEQRLGEREHAGVVLHEEDRFRSPRGTSTVLTGESSSTARPHAANGS